MAEKTRSGSPRAEGRATTPGHALPPSEREGGEPMPARMRELLIAELRALRPPAILRIHPAD